MRPNLAMLTNPLGGYNLRHGGAVTEFARQAGIAVGEGREPGEMAAALRVLAPGKPDVLVVNGGDGTVRAVASILRKQRIFEREPILALLRGGSTNMIQNDVGLSGKPLQAMQRLVSDLKEGVPEDRLRFRVPLRVCSEIGDTDEYGFFWGVGALPRVIRATQAGYARGSRRGPIGETLALLRVMGSLFLGIRSGGDAQLDPEWIDWQWAVDAVSGPERSKRLFAFVTTLDKLILGLGPGSEGTALKLVALKHPHTWSDLLSFLLRRGRPSARYGPNFDFETGEQLVLQVTGDWVLDGELFAGSADGALFQLKSATAFQFLTS